MLMEKVGVVGVGVGAGVVRVVMVSSKNRSSSEGFIDFFIGLGLAAGLLIDFSDIIILFDLRIIVVFIVGELRLLYIEEGLINFLFVCWLFGFELFCYYFGIFMRMEFW